MSVFDVNNPPSEPDSDLDSDLSLVETMIVKFGASTLDIAPGDWVDVSPGYISPDPTWGLSFQVFNLDPQANQVSIMVWDSVGNTYGVVQMDALLVTNNFRRV